MKKASLDSFTTDNARQRINISPDSMSIIKSDMTHFFPASTQLSTVMNRIFYNSFFDSKANLSLRFQHEEIKYTNYMKNHYPDVIKLLIDIFRNDVQNEIENLGKGSTASILLSRKSLDIIQGIDEESENYKCYKKRSVMLNTFFTEYAKLSDNKRFEICQSDLIGILNRAIAGSKGIRIKEGCSDKVFWVIKLVEGLSS